MEKSPDETFNLRQLREALRDTTVIPNAERVRSPMPEACLVCVSLGGPGRGRRIQLGNRELVIGRDSGCAVTVSDQSVSRQHARIELLTDGGYQVTDLGSTHGTFINDIRVRSEKLQDGSFLRVGDCIFRFFSGWNVEAACHQELQRLTTLDPLTGLRNRRWFEDYLERKLGRAWQRNRGLAVILFDIDHFKVFKNRLGQLAGDFILKNLASRFQALTRSDELLARYGGDEFALVLPEATVERAKACAERFRQAVDGQTFKFDKQCYLFTVSAGVGFVAPSEMLNAADLLRQAVDGLYEAKRDGCNCVAPIARASRPDVRTSRFIPRSLLRTSE
jgi:two-component system, cell cycle response regulator